MQVFIMRHGDAVLKAESDLVRPLTLCGLKELRQIALWLNNKSLNIERILVSPYLRAEQTLATIREILILPPEEEIMPELTPNGDYNFIAHYLQVLGFQKVESVLIISHLPLVGYLVSRLCPKEVPLMFDTSAIACVNFNSDVCEGKLEWQISPSNLN